MTTTIDFKLRRANCFKLLAACFYEPDRELFLAERLCENLITLFEDCHCQKAVMAAMCMRNALLQSSEQEMGVEYARLFVGPFELLAPPYGSIYLEKARRLMGDSTMEVQRIYHDAGLTLEVKEAPDHIAFELEYMHSLSLWEANASAEDDNARVRELALKQSKFFHQFLAPWVPDFCQAIRKGTDTVFYMNLADCLESFVESMTAVYELTGICKPKEENCAYRAAV